MDESDEAGSRAEMARTLSVCLSCQRCVGLCGVFSNGDGLFAAARRWSDGDAGSMTPHEQDELVDRCVVAGECTIGCPYGEPGPDQVDVPALMLQMLATRHAHGRGERSRVVSIARRVVPVAVAEPCPYGGVRGAGGSVVGCCGRPALLAGDRKGFERRATAVARAVADGGPCEAPNPACDYVLAAVLPTLGEPGLGRRPERGACAAD